MQLFVVPVAANSDISRKLGKSSMISLSVSLSADPSNGRVLRAMVRDAWSGAPAPSSDLDDVLLITSELFANATEATHPRSEPIEISVEGTEFATRISVTNTGPSFDIPNTFAAPPSQHGGRGLLISRNIGKLVINHDGQRSEVTVDIERGDQRRHIST